MLRKMINFIFYVVILLLFAGAWFTFENKNRRQDFTIGVVAGTNYETKTREFKNVFEVKLYKDNNRILNDVADGWIDAGIMDRLMGLAEIKERGYRNLKLAGDLLWQETVAVAFNKEDKALRQTINQALTLIINDGTYDRISRKYFGGNILKGIKRKVTYPKEPAATDSSWKRILKKGRLVFAMSGGYPPFNYFDKNNHLTGFDVEIATAVCQKLAVKYVPLVTPWDGIIDGLRVKLYDGIWGSMAITSERLKKVDFSDPYYLSGAQLLVRDDSPITGPETLQKEQSRLFPLPKF